ncbi:hypothetical protein STEG23_005031 [Scotinomys teguina]
MLHLWKGEWRRMPNGLNHCGKVNREHSSSEQKRWQPDCFQDQKSRVSVGQTAETEPNWLDKATCVKKKPNAYGGTPCTVLLQGKEPQPNVLGFADSPWEALPLEEGIGSHSYSSVIKQNYGKCAIQVVFSFL